MKKRGSKKPISLTIWQIYVGFAVLSSISTYIQFIQLSTQLPENFENVEFFRVAINSFLNILFNPFYITLILLANILGIYLIIAVSKQWKSGYYGSFAYMVLSFIAGIVYINLFLNNSPVQVDGADDLFQIFKTLSYALSTMWILAIFSIFAYFIHKNRRYLLK